VSVVAVVVVVAAAPAAAEDSAEDSVENLAGMEVHFPSAKQACAKHWAVESDFALVGLLDHTEKWIRHEN
jgi:hypothetical protein